MPMSDDVLGLMHSRGYWETLEDDEAEFMWDMLLSVPTGSTIIEIGCQLGRSSVVLASAAKRWNLKLVFVDFWTDAKFAPEWMTAMRGIGYPFTLYCMRSAQAYPLIHTTDPSVGFLYIDGDHETEGVGEDCINYLPMIKKGGIVAFHDCGRDSLPAVLRATQIFMDPLVWEPIGQARTLAAWRHK